MTNKTTKQTLKIIKGELLFQLSTCGLKPVCVGESTCGWDIALIEKHSDGNTWCEYVIRVHYSEITGVSLLNTIAVNGYVSGYGLEIIKEIERKIKLVNKLLEKDAE